MEIAGDVVCLPPREIRPIHDPRDPKLLHEIFRSMRREGWLGRPLLAVRGDGFYQALTGSHRLAAALQAQLEKIPVIVPSEEVSRKIRASRFFPKAPPFLADDLFKADESWVGRFILMDHWLAGIKKPWSRESLERLRELGHQDMIQVMSVRKWPCQG